MSETQQENAVELSAVPEVSDALAKLAETSGMPTVLLTRIQADEWCVWAAHGGARLGIGVGLKRPAEGIFCREVCVAGSPVVIDDAGAGPYREHPSYVELGVTSYLGVPFRMPDGRILGTVCALDSKPHAGLDAIVPHFELLSRMLAHELHMSALTRDTLAALARENETAASRERFLAMVAHDLRSPLAAIDATARQMLRAPDRPANVTTGAERVLRGTERMRRLIDDLLDYARGRLGGGIPIARVAIEDTAGLVHGLLDDVCSSRRTCRLERRFELPHPTRALWDRDRISQALINVFVNACDHGSSDTVVQVSAHLSRNRDVVIDVVNEGEIRSEDRSSIFEPFHGSRDSGGLGLGLFIAKRIIEAHGGSIDITGVDGETHTSIRIPLGPLA